MRARTCVPIVVVLAMVLTMVFTSAVLAANEAADTASPTSAAVTESTSDAVEAAPTATPAPTTAPTAVPTAAPTTAPTAAPTAAPTTIPTVTPTAAPVVPDVVRINPAYSEDNANTATTIQKGVNKVAVGGTVIVEEGTYSEVVKIDKSVTLLSDKDMKAVVNGGFIVYTNREKVVIGAAGQGFTINGTSGNGTLGAAVSINSGCNNCKVVGNTINVSGGYGIITAGAQNGHEFAGNVITGSQATALIFISRQTDSVYPEDPINQSGSMDYSNDIAITNNILVGSAASGIILDAKNSPVSGNTFKLNVAPLGARLYVKVNTNFASAVSGNKFTALAGFTHLGMQFKDATNTWDLEALRNANSFDQAVYFAGGYDRVDQVGNPIRGNNIYYYIQDAVDFAYSYLRDVLGSGYTVSQDTIYVGAGTYSEHVVVHPATQYNNVKIALINRDEAKADYSAVIQTPVAEDQLSLEIVNVPVHLEGFTVYGMHATFADGSYFNKNKFTGRLIGAEISANDLDTVRVATVSQNLFVNNTLGGLLVDSVRCDKTNNMTITGNVFANNGVSCTPCGQPAVIAYGCRVQKSINVNIYDNSFYSNTGNGLELDNVNNNFAYEHVPALIMHNYIKNNGINLLASQLADVKAGNGIFAVNCKDIQVSDNYCIKENKGNGIVFSGCHNITVSGNNDKIQGYEGIVRNGRDGVLFSNILKPGTTAADAATLPSFRNMGNVNIIENTIGSNGAFGVDGIAADKLMIKKNTVNGNGTGGIVNAAADDADVLSNIIDNNKGVPGDALSLEIADDVNILSNEIVGNSGIGIDLRDGDAIVQLNLVKSNVGGGIAVRYSADADIQKNNILTNGSAKGDVGGIYIRGFAVAHYNNIVGNLPWGLRLDNESVNLSDEFAKTLDTQYRYGGNPKYFTFNFWGDASGPADAFQKPFADINAGKNPGKDANLLGDCNGIVLPDSYYYRGVSVNMYAPWISNQFEALGTYVNGKTAEPVIPFAVKEGWNFISTPKLLALDAWSDIIKLGNDLDASMVLGYDAASKKWLQAAQMTLTPQSAYFVRMKSVDLIPLVIKTHTLNDNGWDTPAISTLTKGWNLVAKADDNKDPMTVKEVLAPVQNNWSYVIHPDIDYGYGRDQEEFTYTSATSGNKYMFNFAGYWVYMNSTSDITGGTTSYVWDPDINKINKLLSLTDKILKVTPIINPD